MLVAFEFNLKSLYCDAGKTVNKISILDSTGLLCFGKSVLVGFLLPFFFTLARVECRLQLCIRLQHFILS